jgi:hypothetical protein
VVGVRVCEDERVFRSSLRDYVSEGACASNVDCVYCNV